MKFKVTSPFGALEEFREQPHTGIDISTPIGTELYSPVEGIVERIIDYGNENVGKGLIIRTEEGERLIFGHLSDWKVKLGEHIDKGELIGLSGNTGNSTGPHLHLGLMENGQYVDPSAYLNVFTPGMWENVKDFLLLESPIGHWLKEIGFNIIQSEIFFLIPAILLLGLRLMIGKNFTGSWIIPLIYAYVVTEKF